MSPPATRAATGRPWSLSHDRPEFTAFAASEGRISAFERLKRRAGVIVVDTLAAAIGLCESLGFARAAACWHIKRRSAAPAP